MVDIKAKLQLVPKKPGCYQMKDINGHVIYVGKAKILQNRLKSYFVGSHDAKTTKLVSDIHDFEYIITNSEVEAFLLEINFIKEYRPKYNILLMDDKTYPYICLTNEQFPRLIMIREVNSQKRQKMGKMFGPYPNVNSCRETIDILNKLFPFRKCDVMPKKECLYYSLHYCLAPCVKKVSIEQYDEFKNEVIKILSGNNKDLLRVLETKMNEASENLEFERAIEFRERINHLMILNDEQKMTLNDGVTRDILGYYTSDDLICIQMFHMRRGQIIKRTGIVNDLNDNIDDLIVSYLAQFYSSRENLLPQEILIPFIENTKVLESYLKTKVIIPIKGTKKKLLDLVCENAKTSLENLQKERLQKINKTTKTLEDLAGILSINYPKYIELFDNSNISGASSVSGMVVYIDGQVSKKHYRKYHIKEVVGADDYHTMQEVARRRLKRLKTDHSYYPNLIIVDGGKPQVQAFLEIMKELNINDINLIGLVKDDKHKTRGIIQPQINQSEVLFKEYQIDKRSNLMLLLESMQEEVHRFAIGFFRQVHSQGMLASSLDKITGIGAQRKKILLTNFQNIDEIKNASVEKLKSLGIPQEVIIQLKEM